MATRHGVAVAVAALTGLLAVPLPAQQSIPRTAIREAAANRKDTIHRVVGGRVDTVSIENQSRVPIRRGEIVVVPTDSSTRHDPRDQEQHVDLPNRYMLLGRDGQFLTLRLRVGFDGRGLRYDPTERAFVGELMIGLEDTLRPNQWLALSTPIQVQVTGEADRADPRDFDITHTNIPYARIKVWSSAPNDTIHVLVQPVFDPTGVRTPVPIQRIPVQVVTSQRTIQGFGLQTTTVTIRAPGAPAGEQLVLSSDPGGRFDADTLSLGSTGVATTKLRSEGVGSARVYAHLGILGSGLVELRYSLPWTFLAAAGLGGLVGTLVRRRLKETTGRATLTDFVLGMAGGLLGAVAYALGVNLFGVDLSVRFGEAATFVAAAISAALDLPGLSGVRAKLANA